MLKRVDGMAAIDEVTAAIDQPSAPHAGLRRPKAARKRYVRRLPKRPPQGQASQSAAAKASEAGLTQGRVGACPPEAAHGLQARQKQARTAQKPYPTEVDEGVMNPLISCTFRSLTRCRAPIERGTGVVLRFALSHSRDTENSGRPAPSVDLGEAKWLVSRVSIYRPTSAS